MALLWADASQDNDSDIARLLRLGQAPHSGVWTTSVPTQEPPISLARLLDQRTLTVPCRLEAWKAACVNSWIHRHGAACGKEFVSELSCRNHACRTTAEQRQLSLLTSCRFQDKPIRNYLPQLQKRQTLAPNSKPKFYPGLIQPLIMSLRIYSIIVTHEHKATTH